MSGISNIGRPTDRRAAQVVAELMSARGWLAKDVAERSKDTGHPDRTVSERTVYRVINSGYVPAIVAQFEIAAAFGLIPPHIWGRLPIPDEALHPMEVAA